MLMIESVLRAAEAYLQGKKVRDLVVGISLLAVELDDGQVGVSYVLREDLPAGCSIFPFGRRVIGRPAGEIAAWARSGRDDLQRGIGMAVLTAASRSQPLTDCQTVDRPFGVLVQPDDVVGMIGLIAPVAKQLGPRAKQLYVLDRGISLSGDARGQVVPMEEQSRLLPQCDVVVLSGTTMINGSIDSLLELCSGAREIVMIGASTPMFPAAFQGTNVTVLAGSWWKAERKADIFRSISLACGISELGAYAIKKTVPVA